MFLAAAVPAQHITHRCIASSSRGAADGAAAANHRVAAIALGIHAKHKSK